MGVNGITNEALLAVLIDRLEGFQRGPFACDENAAMLVALQTALGLASMRSHKRDRDGIEGTHQVGPASNPAQDGPVG